MLFKIAILSCLLITTIHASDISNYFKKIEINTDEKIHSLPEIDFIYMINLDRRPERFARSKDALAPFGIVPYRFSAVNGWEEITPKALGELGIVFEPGIEEGPVCTVYRHAGDKEYTSFEIMKEKGTAYYCHSLSRGAIGCLLSHLSILQHAYDSNYNTIWIMEDDIKIISNPRELSYFVQTLNQLAPDWDVFFTDNEIKGGNGEPVPCTVIRPRPLVTLKPLEYYLNRSYLTHDITKIGMRFGSASMIINRSGMKKLLDYFKTYKVYFPYDIDYFFVPEINLYTSNRDIVTNISGGESDNARPSYLDQAN